MKTDTTNWQLLKLGTILDTDENLTADEILRIYCDEMDSGCYSRVTRLRARVDAWRQKHYPICKDKQRIAGKR